MALDEQPRGTYKERNGNDRSDARRRLVKAVERWGSIRQERETKLYVLDKNGACFPRRLEKADLHVPSYSPDAPAMIAHNYLKKNENLTARI